MYLTYKEALSTSDKKKWLEAINEEKISLKENDVWDIVDRSKVKSEKLLRSKWIFKIKQDGRYRARFVVKGCEQDQGIDYQ